MRIGILISMMLASVLMFSGVALAHCGSCGAGDAAHASDCGCEACSAHSAHEGHGEHGKAMHAEITSCPGCGMDGGLCTHCEGGAEAVLRDMAVSFCPDCLKPDELCANCSVGVADAVVRMGSLSANVMSAPAHSMAYMEGTMYGDMEGLFGSLIQAAVEQGLMNENTHVGSAYPFAMAEGWNPDSVVYAGISFPEGTEPAAPLKVFEVPAGNYLVFNHVGPYEQLVHSWLAAFAFGNMAGIEFGDGPAGEHYVSDPGTTPVDELLTQIFIPLAATEGHGSSHGM